MFSDVNTGDEISLTIENSDENKSQADGISDADIGLRIRWRKDKAFEDNAVIDEIAPWSPAAQEGTVKIGDVLTSVNGNTIKTSADLMCLQGPEGSKVQLAVLRPRSNLRFEAQYRHDFNGPIWPKPMKRESAYRKRVRVLIKEKDGRFQDRSLFIFGLRCSLRKICIALQDNIYWNALCLFFIVLNMVVLTVRDPMEARYNRDSNSISILDKADFALTIFFVIEAFVKIIAHGFLFGHLAYLDTWLNRIDFLVVLCSVADVCLFALRHSMVPLISDSITIPYEYSTFVTSVKAMRSFRCSPFYWHLSALLDPYSSTKVARFVHGQTPTRRTDSSRYPCIDSRQSRRQCFCSHRCATYSVRSE
jgi:hypothetical protein